MTNENYGNDESPLERRAEALISLIADWGAAADREVELPGQLDTKLRRWQESGPSTNVVARLCGAPDARR